MTSTTVSVPAGPMAGIRRLAAQPWVAPLLVFIGCLATAIWLTWPMAKDPSELFYGGAGDAFGALATLREYVETNQPPFLPGTLSDLSAPEGLAIAWIRGMASLPLMITLYSLGEIFGPVAAYNIFAVAAFPFTGLATFLLARKLSGNGWAAAIAAFAFAFYPYAALKAHGHYEFAHGWVIVIMVWRTLEALERPSLRNGVLAGLATVLAMSWTPYFILVAGIAFAALGVTGLVIAWRRRLLRQLLPAAAAAATIVLVYLGGFYVLSTRTDAGQGLRENNTAQLNTYSARAYEYVVPHATHPVFGDETAPWLQARIHGSNSSESTLYLGLTVLALAFLALLAAIRRKVPDETRRAVILLTVMGLVAGWVSAPPEGVIFGQTIPFPSKIVTEISATWRVYARLVTDVMLAAALLSAIGMASLLRGRSVPLQAVLIVVIGFSVIRLDLWPARQGVNPITAQPIYAVLEDLPPGTVAAYPLIGPDQFGETFDQQWYDKPVLNGFEQGSEAEQRARQLEDLSRDDTAERLAALGVRYIVITNPLVRQDLKTGKGLTLIAEDPSGAIYRVAPPARRVAGAGFLSDGFGDPEPGLGGQFHWLLQPTGRIELDGACRTCEGRLNLVMQSFGRPRTVEIRDADGARLVRRRVVGETTVSVPVRFSRQTELEISTTPGPTPIADVVPGTPDPRSLSVGVRVAALRLQPGR